MITSLATVRDERGLATHREFNTAQNDPSAVSLDAQS